MKKLLMLFSLAVIFTFFGCHLTPKGNNSVSTVDPTAWSEGDAELLFYTNGVYEYLEDEDGSYLLKLPNAGDDVQIYLSDDCLKYLRQIDEALFIAAGAKIYSNKTDSQVPFFEIYLDEEKYLCLYGEVIRKIDPPRTETYDGEVISDGCGYDHEHLNFRERITVQPVSLFG